MRDTLEPPSEKHFVIVLIITATIRKPLMERPGTRIGGARELLMCTPPDNDRQGLGSNIFVIERAHARDRMKQSFAEYSVGRCRATTYRSTEGLGT